MFLFITASVHKVKAFINPLFHDDLEEVFICVDVLISPVPMFVVANTLLLFESILKYSSSRVFLEIIEHFF
jgi:hypothetical protein